MFISNPLFIVFSTSVSVLCIFLVRVDQSRTYSRSRLSFSDRLAPLFHFLVMRSWCCNEARFRKHVKLGEHRKLSARRAYWIPSPLASDVLIIRSRRTELRNILIIENHELVVINIIKERSWIKILFKRLVSIHIFRFHRVDTVEDDPTLFFFIWKHRKTLETRVNSALI